MQAALFFIFLVEGTTAAFANSVKIEFFFEEFRYYFAPAVPGPDTEISGNYTFEAPAEGFSGEVPLTALDLAIDGNQFSEKGTTLYVNGYGLSGNTFALENLETGFYKPGIPGFLIQLSSSSNATYTTKASSNFDIWFSGSGSWQISAVSEPTPTALFTAGIAALALLLQRRVRSSR